MGFVLKISFFLSKYIYSSLCSTNDVSHQIQNWGTGVWVL